MPRTVRVGWVIPIVLSLVAHSAVAASKDEHARPCADGLTRAIPVRPATAEPGSTVVEGLMDVSGEVRDEAVSAELLAGNIPTFLRHLTPVVFDGTLPDGQDAQITICVMPDYLAVGTDQDFVRVPMGLPAAAEVAEQFGFLLPTTRMVDAIYDQATVQLAPSPMPANDRMRSTPYLLRHNETVERQRAATGRKRDALTAGQKKDLVLSNRLRSAPGRVAIYGWHRVNGNPIQPLSTVHGENYADYSHGIRLVSDTAFVDGAPVPLARVLQDPALSRLVSSEGPIAAPRALLETRASHVPEPKFAAAREAGKKK